MPTNRDWQELVEVLGPVAENVDQKYVEDQAKDEGNPENPAEDEAEAQAESKEEKPEGEARYTQKDLERLIKARIGEVKEAEKKAAEKARREEAEKRAEENEEFKTVAETRKERIAELEAEIESLKEVQEKVTAYSETLDTYAESRLKELNLPKGVTKLLGNMDPKEKLDWLAENESDFAVTEKLPAGEQPDTSGTPEADNAAREEYQRAFARGF